MKNLNIKSAITNLLAVSLLTVISISFTVVAADKLEINTVATLRDHTEIDTQKEPNRIYKVVNKDIKQGRNYPMQPPIIPHTIRGYEVNRNNNKCMSCHSRHRTEKSQAPMVSVTHYMDRDGNFLADVSPRRYFCNQCHVIQLDAEPLIENSFIDMNSLMKSKTVNTDQH
ncbi:nitrate reductase cytochrome c-type subunit [Colwellia sp. 1_MG-2023]|jgi:cytochrome c-type protein NapB|uniref:nitrate reductase cytochrome c-type subunit n=1 Tax=unclassified Colwellia TaxID=196834 RepID=UPI001C095095|nr:MULTISPECIES: nitrate reductase cytochrome c-type subunit [unclassified Colwellia]MBU2924774.1 nitrate reductase cytochrome c-type subunit [Colwellia sp. C2M11]MDO6489538.1 nitrate reductase cytochrome c-type subunit [Colwellia sp. 6_MG-2023]MDO6653847.1 nitrate reductase cytochrome c-type subunit [Colwellia sp. 3_MG-2023]MDO6667025.1 nitrate reductase cytochrome c-type subunit [Colwellia sp. 2_MG-2023]MDO6691429.1 nitrate reductase cytochrome c-type subunit [Colwellia sp. 1_MG-2023]